MTDNYSGACLNTARRAVFHVSHLCVVDPQVKEWLRVGGKIPACLLNKAQAMVPATNLSSTAQAGFLQEAAAKMILEIVTIATTGFLSLETTPRIAPKEVHYGNIGYEAANLLAAWLVPWTIEEHYVSGTDGDVTELASYRAREALRDALLAGWACESPPHLAGTEDRNTPA